MDARRAVLLAAAGAVAGGINSVAGGGTLISFPAAVAAGLTPLVANASNSVALTPASLAAAWAYRRELARDAHVVKRLAIPSALGGGAGAVLLLVTPERLFDAIVPALVLLATGLFLFQNVRAANLAKAPAPETEPAPWILPPSRTYVLGLQFAVAVYGGYFGAGTGILTLALLSLLGGTDLHRMNAVKIVLAAAINGVAALAFVILRTADFETSVILGVSAAVGAFLGAALARRVNARIVRWIVVAIGFTLSGILAYRRWLA